MAKKGRGDAREGRARQGSSNNKTLHITLSNYRKCEHRIYYCDLKLPAFS